MKEILDLHAFVDGELSPAESQRIRALLEMDQTVQTELSAISNLVDFVREKSAQHQSEECWKVCVVRLNELDRSKRVEGFMGKYAWALCAGLFVLVIGGRWAVKDVRGDSARTLDLFSVIHSSPAPVSSQNERIYAQLFRRSKEAQSGVRILGRTLGTVMDVPVDRLDLADKDGPLTYFVIQDVINFEDASQVSDGSGLAGGMISKSGVTGKPALNCVIWVDGGRTFVLCGRRSIANLADATVRIGLKTSIN